MPYFAAAAVRGPAGWSGAELDLGGVADIDEVVDRLREVDPDAEVSLLFVESDDCYLVIMRLDEGEDLRIFSSDAAFADESRLGALLIGDIRTPAVEVDLEPVVVGAAAGGGTVAGGVAPSPGGGAGGYAAGDPLADFDDDVDALADEEDDEEPVADPDAEPVGDADLLADLGVSARRLLALCSRDGMLPADVTAEVCQTLGCGDEIEELREA
ncbi:MULTISPECIES: tRNA adenosine deaminase-associated protein [unclassified Solwaraspora]|uniref:tRNA adenosine deaminase-associated protein n=1 Tax=unclassified Solwaraspora TaxID=2627926 RepID=UPI00259BDA2B|nr:tRNA adenosine deaminase-associated protein [Solwaraspora sp. WMMA2056]WJK41265.1 tRNA adenosine deaminase-associated protein [Solwaraspora sp. WMMA2056]